MPPALLAPAVAILLVTAPAAPAVSSKGAATAAEGADPIAADCPAGNLLAGRLPVGAPAALAIVTDGQVTAEGARWSSAPAFVLGAGAPQLTFDLGAERAIRALLVQADANDAYPLTGSLDGIVFEPLVTVSPVDGHGLRTRAVRLAGRPIRFLRLAAPAALAAPSAVTGDGAYAVAEMAAYCVVPAPWPPRFAVVDAPLEEPPSAAPLAWNDVTSRWWELVLALLGLALLLGYRRSRDASRLLASRGLKPTQMPHRSLTAADRLLAVLGILAALTYFNFGAFHFGNYIHNWDTLHYYVGAKYFRELGYDGLYECIAVADTAQPEWRERVAARRITNLRTNVLETTAAILAHPERCTARFTPERWTAFGRDVSWFRARESPQRWDELSSDHGYNATPVWNLAGSLLANLAPATDRQILLLTLLDPLYFLAMAAVIGWAFGWRTLAVALLVLATYFPCRFYWTGGAFLRWDWLFYTVASVACMRKDRPILGGLALGYAALLRVFPGVLALGPALALTITVGAAVHSILRSTRSARSGHGRVGRAMIAALRGEPARRHLRFLAGAAVAAVLFVPLGAAVAGGFDAYRGFVANSLKHKSTPLTNNMGLRTAITYRPAEVGRHLVSDRDTDPWQRWKAARLAAWSRSRGMAAAIAIAVLVLIGLAVARNPEPWLAPALASMAIAFVFELTSYYYAFVIVPALLWSRWRPAAAWLLGLAALSQFVSLAPLPGMSSWRDEQYTWISLATLVVFVVLVARFAYGTSAARTRAAQRVDAAAD